MQEYLEGLHEFLPIGKIVAACLWKVHLEELIWHQFFSANQLEVIRPPACFHATWSPLIVISSAAVDGPPLVHISDAGGDCLWNYFNEGYGSSVCTVTWPELYLKPLPHSGSRVSFTLGESQTDVGFVHSTVGSWTWKAPRINRVLSHLGVFVLLTSICCALCTPKPQESIWDEGNAAIMPWTEAIRLWR